MDGQHGDCAVLGISAEPARSCQAVAKLSLGRDRIGAESLDEPLNRVVSDPDRTVVALTGSAMVALALAAHAFGEGLATGALLGGQPRHRVAGWLAFMCLSPVLGALAADSLAVPESAEPIPLALAAGVLLQAAWVSLRTISSGLRRSPTRPPAPVSIFTRSGREGSCRRPLRRPRTGTHRQGLPHGGHQ